MKKVFVFSALLVAGLAGSQITPSLLGDGVGVFRDVVQFLTMVGLAFIMIHVGYEFELDRSRLRSYGWDYVVAMTTAALPWIFAALYFVLVLLPPDVWSSGAAWKEVLLAGRFAAPTATGVLFSMLAAAGLGATWMYRKTRVLAIFDDLDTVLLMIPLKILMVGLAWQLGVVVAVMVVLLWIAWKWMRRIAIPTAWPWVLGYAGAIAVVSEVIYVATKLVDHRVPIHLEVLLPAFVLGCVMRIPEGENPHADDAREGHQDGPPGDIEQRVATIISAVFMVLVGLSMPPFFAASSGEASTVTAAQPPLSVAMILLHVIVLTIIINVGKMFPAFVYRREAHWRERLAVAIAMCPRGEVGAGIILLSLDYAIGGPIVTVAILSLALNLVATPLFVWAIRVLLAGVPGKAEEAMAA